MIILVVANSKGGVLKTSTTISFACCAVLEGRRVVLLDTDTRQRSLAEWAKLRGSGPLVEVCAPADVPRVLERLRAAGIDLVIIDTPGHDDAAVGIVLRAATLCVIPSRPELLDLRGSIPTRDAAARLRRPYSYLLTDVTAPHSSRVASWRDRYRECGLVVDAMICHRVGYGRAIAKGRAVVEDEPDSPAATETWQAWRWVITRAQGVIDG
jgi:chromosome partitioning protein